MPRDKYGLPGIYNNSPITLPNGRGSALAVDSSGRLIVSPTSGGSDVNIADIGGTATAVNNGASNAGTLRITIASDSTGVVGLNTGTNSIGDVRSITTSITPGTAATSLGKAEDSVHASGDVGVFALNIGNEAQTTLAADGDYIGHSVDTKGNGLVVGNVASGITDSGNPVKVGGKFNATLPTVTDGQRVDFQLSARGVLQTQIIASGSTPQNYLSDNADGVATSATINKLAAISRGSLYNGTTWDLIRSISNATNSIGTGITAAGILAQVDDTSPTAITENQFGNLRMSADRSLLTTIQNSYTHISTATTTTVKSGVGTLKAIIVNTLGTVASTTTIYDNTTGSGTVIGVINTLALAGTFSFNVQFTTGLTLVTTGTVAPDITVSYK